MENLEKNNRLFLVIGLAAVVLVSAVGISFAYFVSGVSQTGAGGTTAVGTTAKYGDVNFALANAANSSKMEYPGGKAYGGVKVTATNTSGDTHTYNVSYKLNLNYTNTLSADVTYAVYESSSPITTAISCSGGVDTTSVVGKIKYAYSGCTDPFSSLTAVASGTLSKTTSAANITIANGSNSFSMTSGGTKYYYVLITYPNKTTDQTAESGGSVSAKINSANNITVVQS